jgi:serine/threonine protein kinase
MPAETADTSRRRFKIRRCLGRGGFGEVYLAQMVSTDGVAADVALKVLNEHMSSSADAMLRLREEARVLAMLNHPNILSFFDLVVLNGRVTLVTQYVDGADLDRIRSMGALPLKAVLEVGACVADALTTAWTTPQADGSPIHLTHRDIKPSNIRIGRHGEVKLLDFGIAKASGRNVKTQTGLLVGSLPYVPPERFDAEGTETIASDLYSLGCTLLEVFQGRPPFDDLTETQRLGLAMNQAKHDRAVYAAVDNLGLPSTVRDLLLDMLAFQETSRPDPRKLAHTLRDLAEDTPGLSLKRWSRDFAWPEPDHAQGPLDGMTISESALSKHNLTLATVRSVAPADPPAVAATPKPATTWHRNERAAESPAAVVATTVPVAPVPPAPTETTQDDPSASSPPSATPWRLIVGALAALGLGGVGLVAAVVLIAVVRRPGIDADTDAPTAASGAPAEDVAAEAEPAEEPPVEVTPSPPLATESAPEMVNSAKPPPRPASYGRGTASPGNAARGTSESLVTPSAQEAAPGTPTESVVEAKPPESAPPPPQHEAGTGTVCFYRTSNSFGSAVVIGIWEGESRLLAIKNGRFACVPAAAGAHTYIAKAEVREQVTTNVAPNATTYVSVNVIEGSVWGRPQIRVVSGGEFNAKRKQMKEDK